MTANPVVAMVTGASAGLGAEFCRQLSARCDLIIAVARRADRLQALADELQGQVQIMPLIADLYSVEGQARCIEALRQQGPVDYLINNAGFGTSGNFVDSDIAEQQRMVTVHITATVALCRAALPFMCERGRGYIVNVASLGAYVRTPQAAVYGASKAFLNHYSVSLQQELQGTGVKVQSLCPGLTHTEIHDRPSMAAFDKAKTAPGSWMDACEVVAESLQSLAQDRVSVVTGEVNVKMAKRSLQHQLDALS